MQTRRKAQASQDAGRESVKPKRATKKHRLLSSVAQEKPKAQGRQKMESPPSSPRKSVAQSARKPRGEKGPSAADEKSMPQSKASQVTKGHESEMKKNEDKISVNRAPVLTMWVAVVATREGYTYEEGLSFGKAIAGLMAQSKGRSLGLYKDPSEEKKEERKRKRKESDRFCIFGMNVPGKTTEGGLRLALQSGKPISPASVENYLHRSFGANHERAKGAMEDLANSFPSEEIGKAAYSLYEKFRPTVAHGVKGWGAKGFLDVESMQALRKQ